MTEASFSGRTALVTGGGSGIGRAIAIALAAAGASVLVADRNSDAAAATSALTGDAARAFPLDIADAAQWDAALSAATGGDGRLDILVNNAGVVLLEPIRTMSLEQWSHVIDTNMGGTFLGMQMATPRMGEGSAILNIASTAGLRGTALASAYAASKAGIISLTRSAARQFAQDGLGIRVNALCPGPVDTPAHASRPGSIARDIGADAIRERIVSSVPMGRLGAPEEVAAAALFLLSPAASFITGSILPVDGGQAA